MESGLAWYLPLPLAEIASLLLHLTMGDDQTEKPKKLRLSKDAHTDSRIEESDAHDAQSSKPTSAPTPERKSPDEREAGKAKNSKLELSHAPDPLDGACQPIDPDETENLHGSTGPTGSTGSPTESERSPPPIPQHPATADAEPTARPTGSSLPPQESSHSVLPSLIVVGLLFLLLGGAGFGLWKILISDEPARTVDSGEPDEAREAAKAMNPIERAKESIAGVSQLDMDDLTGETEGTGETSISAGDASTPVPEEGRSSAHASPAGEPVIEEAESLGVRAASNAAVEATKTAVSEFLVALRIGGMRRGERPMILIDGRVYKVGDTVQTETGLKFDGIRNSKLAFIDQNDIVYLKSF
jgi:hypothetical protein